VCFINAVFNTNARPPVTRLYTDHDGHGSLDDLLRHLRTVAGSAAFVVVAPDAYV
jgi:hypothetical protein